MNSIFWYIVAFWLGLVTGGVIRWPVVIKDIWNFVTRRPKQPTILELKNYLLSVHLHEYQQSTYQKAEKIIKFINSGGQER